MIFIFLLAVGTITESVARMPVQIVTPTIIYGLLGLFATPPFRRYLETSYDVEFQLGKVPVNVVGTIVNEGL